MEKHTYESAIKKLQEIVNALETGGMPLEKSVKLFEEGAKLAKFCDEELKSAEQKIISLENIKEETNE